MGKSITSPVKRWPGTIVIANPVTLPQVASCQRIMVDAYKVSNDGTLVTEWCVGAWPYMRQLIEEWNIESLPYPDDDKFPGFPSDDVDAFFIWLFEEITTVYNEAKAAVPKD